MMSLRVPLQRLNDRAQKQKSIRYETFVISDSSHKYTPGGVELLSLSPATTEKEAAEAGISRTFYANFR